MPHPGRDAIMSHGPEQDTSHTLMMRVKQDPADPAAWNEFVHRYQPMIRAWCLKWGCSRRMRTTSPSKYCSSF